VSQGVITLFSIPKAFAGPAGEVQRNAVASWLALGSDVEVVLLGSDPGVAEAAARFGVRHVPDVALGEGGAPRLDDAFARTAEVARHETLCFVNADVIFLEDFVSAVKTATSWHAPIVMAGRSVDVDVGPVDTDRESWRADVRRAARTDGRRRGLGALDYIVFTREVFGDLPTFVVGRAGFDNWLVWRARSLGVPVVDASADVCAIHQSHGYGHLAGGKGEAYMGREARYNIELAGGKRHLFTLADASHRLRDGRVVRNPWSTWRIGDIARRVRWKLGLDRTP
jgi:hypothetical protein